MARLVVVSNRVAVPDRGTQTGGLAVAIREALKDKHGIWFGWSGKVGIEGPATTVEHDGISYVTVNLTKADHSEFYNGFANSVLWPILHYRLDLVEFTRRDLGGYLRVNDYLACSLERLLQPDVVDHDLRVGIASGECARLLQPPPGKQIDGQRVSCRGLEHAVEARIGRVVGEVAIHHDAHTSCPWRSCPLRDRLGDTGVGRVDRFDETETVRIPGSHLERIAGVIAVQRERRDENRAVHADRVHGRDHLFARDLRRAA
jgi:hypothetical protein